METKLPFIDNLIILIYFVIIISIGVIVGIRRKNKSSDGFFLAGRSLNWLVIGAALFAANISTTHLVGLVAQGFEDGMVWGNFEWFAFPGLILLSLVFAPVYYRTRISTLPEFLEKRYGPYTRTMLGVIALLFAIFAHIGISLYAGAVVFRNFFGFEINLSIAVIISATLIYTLLGGLRAVVVTETVQTVILVAGTIVLGVLAVKQLPAHEITSLADFKAAVKPNQLNMVNGPESANLPFISIVLGLPVIAIYYFGSDQTIVQKVLGARSKRDAQLGPVFTGFLKILPVFMMVVPGIVAYVLFGDRIQDANDALPTLIREILPAGIKGLLAAALIAALMSTIAAGLNSTGTLVSMDIVKRFRPSIADRTLLVVGRVTILVVLISAAFWSPWIASFKSIFEAINVILVSIAPPVTAVMVLGVFWKRANQQGALTTMISGFTIGIVIFCLEFEPISGTRYITYNLGIPLMMQAFWLFAICSVIHFVVSLSTPPPPPEKTRDIAMDKPWDFITKERISGFTDPRILSLILVVVMAILYIIFR
jgi:SSS family solute:Na+ symporter